MCVLVDEELTEHCENKGDVRKILMSTAQRPDTAFHFQRGRMLH